MLRIPRIIIQRRTHFRKADTHVCLLQDVAGLGVAGEIVLAGLGYTRNYLVPFQLAYPVPRIRGKPVLPESWAPPVVVDTQQIEAITPAFMTVAYTEPTAAEVDAVVQEEIANDIGKQLEHIKFIECERMAIGETNRFFGSITAQDVSDILLEEYNVTVSPELLELPQPFLRDFGTFAVSVDSPSGKVTFDLIIKSQVKTNPKS